MRLQVFFFFVLVFSTQAQPLLRLKFPAAPRTTTTNQDVIPAWRLINWSNYVGVESKPSRTVYTNLPVVSAFEINRAITNAALAGTNQIVVLSNQVYELDSAILLQNGVTLRGQGTNTVLREPSTGGSANLVKMGQLQEVSRSNTDIHSGAWRNSTNLSVTADMTTLLAVGQPFIVTATNDWNYVYPFGLESGTPTQWAGDDPDTPVGNRQRGETVRLTAITDGTNLTFWPPLTHDFTNTPSRISYVATSGYQPVQYVGLENLALHTPTNQIAIYINGNHNSWISNVHFRIFSSSLPAIQAIRHVYRFTVQHCAFEGYTATPSAMDIRNDASGWIVENNWFNNIYQAIVTASRGNNHVFAGNYSHGLASGTAEFVTHGAHKQNIYWAHNRGIALRLDLIHGSSSHNTIFRNYFLGDNYLTNVMGPVWIDQWNLTNSLVANVLGYGGMSAIAREKSAADTASTVDTIISWDYNGFDRTDAGGRYTEATTIDHGNVTYESGSASITWESGRSQTLTNCYFYGLNRPSWWGTNLAWPAFGPDVSGYTNMIPAQIRFLFGTNSF